MMPEMPSDWPHTSFAGKIRRKKAWRRWDSARKRQLTELWTSPIPIGEIADQMETSPGACYLAASKMGLPPRSSNPLTAKFSRKGPRTGRAPKKTRRKSDSSGNRRFAGVEQREGPKIVLEAHHPAHRAGTTFFPKSVMPAARLDRLLKSGHNSRKIGERLTKGRWAGQPIFTLTLEERATCPRTCKEWATCYGNNMPFAHRIFDDGTLEKRLWGELAALSAANPKGFVVRLHVLGDFFSVGYAEFWRQALVDFPALNIFGFTARQPADPIGALLLLIRLEHRDRFMMRWSGQPYETDCAEVVDKGEKGIGIPCPAESDPDRCCATCGLCMQTDRTITFSRH